MGMFSSWKTDPREAGQLMNARSLHSDLQLKAVVLY